MAVFCFDSTPLIKILLEWRNGIRGGLRRFRNKFKYNYAEMAELVYALVSKTSGRKAVRVRFPLSAQVIQYYKALYNPGQAKTVIFTDVRVLPHC